MAPKSAATASGLSTSTIPTAPVSNSWNSPRSRNPAVPSTLVPTRNHDRFVAPIRAKISCHPERSEGPAFPQPHHQPPHLAPRPSLPLPPNPPLPPAPSLPRPKSRQAPRQRGRGSHRLRLRPRWPHRLLRPPHVQIQKVRLPARRHLPPRNQRQAPPPFHRRKVHTRR